MQRRDGSASGVLYLGYYSVHLLRMRFDLFALFLEYA